MTLKSLSEFFNNCNGNNTKTGIALRGQTVKFGRSIRERERARERKYNEHNETQRQNSRKEFIGIITIISLIHFGVW